MGEGFDIDGLLSSWNVGGNPSAADREKELNSIIDANLSKPAWNLTESLKEEFSETEGSEKTEGDDEGEKTEGDQDEIQTVTAVQSPIFTYGDPASTSNGMTSSNGRARSSSSGIANSGINIGNSIIAKRSGNTHPSSEISPVNQGQEVDAKKGLGRVSDGDVLTNLLLEQAALCAQKKSVPHTHITEYKDDDVDIEWFLSLVPEETNQANTGRNQATDCRDTAYPLLNPQAIGQNQAVTQSDVFGNLDRRNWKEPTTGPARPAWTKFQRSTETSNMKNMKKSTKTTYKPLTTTTTHKPLQQPNKLLNASSSCVNAMSNIEFESVKQSLKVAQENAKALFSNENAKQMMRTELASNDNVNRNGSSIKINNVATPVRSMNNPVGQGPSVPIIRNIKNRPSVAVDADIEQLIRSARIGGWIDIRQDPTVAGTLIRAPPSVDQPCPVEPLRAPCINADGNESAVDFPNTNESEIDSRKTTVESESVLESTKSEDGLVVESAKITVEWPLHSMTSSADVNGLIADVNQNETIPHRVPLESFEGVNELETSASGYYPVPPKDPIMLSFPPEFWHLSPPKILPSTKLNHNGSFDIDTTSATISRGPSYTSEWGALLVSDVTVKPKLMASDDSNLASNQGLDGSSIRAKHAGIARALQNMTVKKTNTWKRSMLVLKIRELSQDMNVMSAQRRKAFKQAMNRANVERERLLGLSGTSSGGLSLSGVEIDNKQYYCIEAQWSKKLHQFLEKDGTEPGRIENIKLCDLHGSLFTSGGVIRKLKPGLILGTHYRSVTSVHWSVIRHFFGCDFPLARTERDIYSNATSSSLEMILPWLIDSRESSSRSSMIDEGGAAPGAARTSEGTESDAPPGARSSTTGAGSGPSYDFLSLSSTKLKRQRANINLCLAYLTKLGLDEDLLHSNNSIGPSIPTLATRPSIPGMFPTTALPVLDTQNTGSLENIVPNSTQPCIAFDSSNPSTASNDSNASTLLPPSSVQLTACSSPVVPSTAVPSPLEPSTILPTAEELAFANPTAEEFADSKARSDLISAPPKDETKRKIVVDVSESQSVTADVVSAAAAPPTAFVAPQPLPEPDELSDFEDSEDSSFDLPEPETLPKTELVSQPSPLPSKPSYESPDLKGTDEGGIPGNKTVTSTASKDTVCDSDTKIAVSNVTKSDMRSSVASNKKSDSTSYEGEKKPDLQEGIGLTLAKESISEVKKRNATDEPVIEAQTADSDAKRFKVDFDEL